MKRSFSLAVAVFPLLVACSSSGDGAEAAPPPPTAGPAGPPGSTVPAPNPEPDPLTGLPTTCFNADIKDNPSCVDDSIGIFVDGARGNDANVGTKASPLKTIGAALTKDRRVFVCEGTYAEALTIAKAAVLDGGFVCGTWVRGDSKARVIPAAVGPALRILAALDAVIVTDFELTSRPAVAPGESSIAVVASASKVAVRRSTITAGAGSAGANGLDRVGFGGSTSPRTSTNGIGNEGGVTPTCSCTTPGTSKPGDGGDWLSPAGKAGGPAFAYAPGYGLGGPMGFVCSTAGTGVAGATAPPGRSPAAAGGRGVLAGITFQPSPGPDGQDGSMGQGGGGGAGRGWDGTSPTSGIGGGSGGCGGCGGYGGRGGQGGGASIAVVAVESSVSVRASLLVTGGGAAGGRGGFASTGAAGWLGGAPAVQPAVAACYGGRGGPGGNGGHGAGGAGGISIGILHSGTAPEVDAATTILPGTAGALGLGAAGALGPGGVNNSGLAGLSEKILNANAL